MLLAIDIGNTFTKFGFYENDFLAYRFNAQTTRRQISDAILNQIPTQSVSAVIISSVPKNTLILNRFSLTLLSIST